MGRPIRKHPIGGCPDKGWRRSFFPAQVRRLRQALVGLNLCKLGKAAEIRSESPYHKRRHEHWINARAQFWVVRVPAATRNYNVVSHLDVPDSLSNLIGDARSIASANMETRPITAPLVLLDNIEWNASRR